MSVWLRKQPLFYQRYLIFREPIPHMDILYKNKPSKKTIMGSKNMYGQVLLLMGLYTYM